jgi:hypothetical protein
MKHVNRNHCVFTSARSTLQGETKYPVCNSAHDDSVLMVKCHGCKAWHCVECYQALCMYKHHERKSTIFRPVGILCVSTFLDTEWDQMAECRNNNAADKEKMKGVVEGTALSVVSDEHSGIIHLEWDHGCCPSCYNFLVPTIPSLQMPELRQSNKPTITFFLWQLDLIDPSIQGCIMRTDVCLVVLTVSPVLTKEEGEQCVYRSASEILNNDHDSCCTILPKQPLSYTGKFWLLIRSTTGDMLSLTHVGCLDPHFRSSKVSHACDQHDFNYVMIV